MKLKYAVVYERTPNNYSAYSPDLPGCISTGETWEDIQEKHVGGDHLSHRESDGIRRPGSPTADVN